jgi:hypothetical protein
MDFATILIILIILVILIGLTMFYRDKRQKGEVSLPQVGRGEESKSNQDEDYNVVDVENNQELETSNEDT